MRGKNYVEKIKFKENSCPMGNGGLFAGRVYFDCGSNPPRFGSSNE